MHRYAWNDPPVLAKYKDVYGVCDCNWFVNRSLYTLGYVNSGVWNLMKIPELAKNMDGWGMGGG